MSSHRAFYSSLILTCYLWLISAIELAAYPDIIYLHIGDPSGTPIRAFINDTIKIDIYCTMNSEETYASCLHVPVAVADSCIDSLISQTEGQVYRQLLNWDQYSFEPPEHGGLNPIGWTNQSFLGFGDLGGEPNPYLRCYEWTKIITFVGHTANNQTLIGQTIACVGQGISSMIGGPSSCDTLGSASFPVIMDQSPVHFYSPSDSAMIKGRIINYSSGSAVPQSGAQVSLFNPDRSCTTDTDGRYWFSKALPGPTRFLLSIPGYDDSSLILNIAPAETTTYDFSIYSGSVEGYVYDSTATPPIPISGAYISVSNSRKTDTTDENGYYRIDDLFAKNYTIRFLHPYYFPDSMESVNIQNGLLITINKNLIKKNNADVGVYYIENIPETIQVGRDYGRYRCDVANYGLDSQTCNVVYSVRPVGSDTVTFIDTESVTVGPLGSHWVNFTGTFTPGERGYEFKVYTVLAGDANLHNDTLAKTVFDLLPLSYVGGVDNNGCSGAVIVNDTAYGISGGYFKIIDFVNPNNQVELSRRQLSGYASDIRMKGKIVYIGECNNGLHTFMAADPTNPLDMGYALLQTGILDISIQGNYAFLACYDIGLVVANLSDSLHPVECARVQFPPDNEVRAIKVSGDYAYIAIANWKLAVINITNPASPVLVNLVPFPLDYLEDIDIYGEHLFIRTATGFIEIVDISNPESPQLITTINYNSCYASGMGIANNHLFIRAPLGIYIYDIADVLDPVYKGRLLVDHADGNILSCNYDIIFLGDGIKVFRWRDPVSSIACEYRRGDINGDGFCNGNDVVYGVRYFKGFGDPPPDSCWNNVDSLWVYSAGDVNGNCEFRGSDISCLVAYFKGIQSHLKFCPWTPPRVR